MRVESGFEAGGGAGEVERRASRGSGGAVGGTFRVAAGRLLRLEMRRSAMIYLVPVVVAMFWFDTYRSSMQLLPTWGARTLLLREGTGLTDFVPFVTGAAAWTGARDGRRRMLDQVAATALPRWAARLTVWAAVAVWAVGAYLLCVGALYGRTASQGAVGAALWWPIPVDVAGLLAFTALGFALGTAWPSRFTAPLAAIGSFVLLLVARNLGGTYVMLAPIKSPRYSTGAPQPDDGVFARFVPDLSIVQVLLMLGIAAAMLGAVGVSRRCGGTGWRFTAIAVTTGGVALVGTSFALVGSAKVSPAGVVTIAAVHDAADDQPGATASVCGGAPVPICLNPVYGTYLPRVVATLEPVLSVLDGVPGAPGRAQQVAMGAVGGDQTDVVRAAVVGDPAAPGRPAVLNLGVSFGYQGNLWMAYEGGSGKYGNCCTSARLWSSPQLLDLQVKPGVGLALVDSLIGYATPAQRAAASGLLQTMGVQLKADAFAPDDVAALTLPAGSAEAVAAQRFAALPKSERDGWLAAHGVDLKAGRITLEQLP